MRPVLDARAEAGLDAIFASDSFYFVHRRHLSAAAAPDRVPTTLLPLSCIYWGALFGGAITSILFNIPGEAWSVATTFDGCPMGQQGQAAEALAAAFTLSFIGSLVAVLLITFLAPGTASFALRFG